VSVGIVAEPEYLFRDTREPAEIFAREVAIQEWIRVHLEPGRPTGEFQTTRDFTYRSRHCATDGLVLVGDAFAFLDPVFSSGVYLALASGIQAADAADAALTAGDVSAARFAAYGRELCHAIEGMRRLVHAFYDHDFRFATFLQAHPELRSDLTDCLIGNLGRDFEPLFSAIAGFAKIPAPLEHGAPLEPAAESS
jgi:flavin-dependent dehydrogenase